MNPIDTLIQDPAAFDHDAERDAAFLRAMQATFRHHYEGCADYRRWCDRVGTTPSDVRAYTDVPHVFVTNYKRRRFITGDESRIALTLTSSGTGGEKSAIYLDRETLRRITRIVHNIYGAFGMTDRVSTNYLCFTYDPRVAKDLGTAFSDKLLTGLTKVGRVHYAIRWNGSEFALDRPAVWRALERFSRDGRPLRVLGFPALLWDLMHERPRRFAFGEGSYVITGGGWKGMADKEIPKPLFREKVADWLGIPVANVRDLYGMVEHGVPYCECEHGNMHVPIYSRVVVRDPVTLKAKDWGEPGLFHMYTPYLSSFPAPSLLTSDVGRLLPDCPCGRSAPRLEVLGRGGVTKHKGCAITALEVLSA